MSCQNSTFSGNILEALRDAIVKEIPDAKVEVSGAGGHFSIDVESSVFAGKSMLQSQRVVYAAITPLMSGDSAPVHAVDSMRTRVPSA